MRSRTFFFGIGITNATPLRPNFGWLCIPDPFSKEKYCWL